MSWPDRHLAVADVERAAQLGAGSPFSIEVRFLGGLDERSRSAFAAAADRWTRVIVGDLPALVVGGEEVDDVVISAQGVAIDGAGGVLGQAGPTALRPASVGTAAFLPATGLMSFDTVDLATLADDGSLDDVIAHEMGHVLGIGTIWLRKGLVTGLGGANPRFVGAGALEQYRLLRGDDPTGVPLENSGGSGTSDAHWRESIFGSELMSGFIDGRDNPLSRVTAASLGDLGYAVDLAGADAYSLPDVAARAESGQLVARRGSFARGVVLPIIPVVVPAP